MQFCLAVQMGLTRDLQWQLHVSHCLHCPHIHCAGSALVDERQGASFIMSPPGAVLVTELLPILARRGT